MTAPAHVALADLADRYLEEAVHDEYDTPRLAALSAAGCFDDNGFCCFVRRSPSAQMLDEACRLLSACVAQAAARRDQPRILQHCEAGPAEIDRRANPVPEDAILAAQAPLRSP